MTASFRPRPPGGVGRPGRRPRHPPRSGRRRGQLACCATCVLAEGPGQRSRRDQGQMDRAEQARSQAIQSPAVVRTPCADLFRQAPLLVSDEHHL